MKTREEYRSEGWSNIEYDDDFFEYIDKINFQLKKYNLTIELSNLEETDGFQPIRIINKKTSTICQ